MMNPENLQQATEKALFNLTADDSLKQRILEKAAGYQTVSRKSRILTSIPAFCTVMAVLMLVLTVMNGLKPVDPASSVEINVFSAGSSDDVSPVDHTGADVFDMLNPDTVVSVELTGIGTITDTEACSSLISLLQHSSVPTDYSFDKSAHTLYIISADGTKLTFNVEEPYLENGSCWSCPEFFVRLHELTDQD